MGRHIVASVIVLVMLSGCVQEGAESTGMDDPQAAGESSTVAFDLRDYALLYDDGFTLRLDFDTTAPVELWAQDASGKRIGTHVVRAITERRAFVDLDGLESVPVSEPLHVSLFAGLADAGEASWWRNVSFAPASLAFDGVTESSVVGGRLTEFSAVLKNEGGLPIRLEEAVLEGLPGGRIVTDLRPWLSPGERLRVSWLQDPVILEPGETTLVAKVVATHGRSESVTETVRLTGPELRAIGGVVLEWHDHKIASAEVEIMNEGDAFADLGSASFAVATGELTDATGLGPLAPGESRVILVQGEESYSGRSKLLPPANGFTGTFSIQDAWTGNVSAVVRHHQNVTIMSVQPVEWDSRGLKEIRVVVETNGTYAPHYVGQAWGFAAGGVNESHDSTSLPALGVTELTFSRSMNSGPDTRPMSSSDRTLNFTLKGWGGADVAAKAVELPRPVVKIQSHGANINCPTYEDTCYLSSASPEILVEGPTPVYAEALRLTIQGKSVTDDVIYGETWEGPGTYTLRFDPDVRDLTQGETSLVVELLSAEGARLAVNVFPVVVE